jgi:hypothetical protein
MREKKITYYKEERWGLELQVKEILTEGGDGENNTIRFEEVSLELYLKKYPCKSEEWFPVKSFVTFVEITCFTAAIIEIYRFFSG